MKKALLLVTMLATTSTVSATSVLSCSIISSVTACAERAVKHCGRTDSDCLRTYGFVPKFQPTTNDQHVWCGLSTDESSAIV